jgi:AcrR family transcriptional regulator
MARKKTVLDRRDIIIRSADRLFDHYGFEKTTMEDISRESGIPRATLYLEFSAGKEDILMAGIERYLNQTLAHMRDLVRQSRSGRLEALKKAMLYYILCAYDRSTQQYYDHTTAERHTKRVRVEMSDFFRTRQEFFVELLRQAALGGEISDEYDFTRIAELLAQGLLVYLPPLNAYYTRDELEKNASAFFSLLLSGLAKNNRALAL